MKEERGRGQGKEQGGVGGRERERDSGALYLIPAAAAAGVKNGEIGGTGLAVDAI